MRGGWSERIDPAVLFFEGKAGQAEVVQLVLLLRGQAADQIGAPARGEGLVDPLARLRRQGGHQCIAGLADVPDVVRVEVGAEVDEVEGHQLAVAVDQVGAGDGERRPAQGVAGA